MTTSSYRPPDLHNQVALVAGATRGAGRGIARMLGEAGATVYCTGRSSRAKPIPANIITRGVPRPSKKRRRWSTRQAGWAFRCAWTTPSRRR